MSKDNSTDHLLSGDSHRKKRFFVEDNAEAKAKPMAIAKWLWTVAGLIVVIVIVGGITRLTESGLSITQWNPVSGALPPLSEADWRAEFALYQQTGEYQNVTGPAGMGLADFNFIYFWEWFHRLIGRIIGLVYALPLAWFWLRGAIPKGYKPRLLLLLLLGAMQGAFGWFMVRSGLSAEMTDVSHFWLSIHLLTALLTLAILVWTALDMRRLAQMPRARPARLSGFSFLVIIILFVQMLLGAWVAGLNAGLVSDSWPLMQGRLVPEYDQSRGTWYAMTHDPFLIQFLHRWWAWVVVAIMVILARKLRKFDRRASIVLHSVLGVQFLLGIATVLTSVSLWVAVGHQAFGALMVIATAWALHIYGRRV